jgi:ABC-type multidrug transport system ATPase subunit
LLTIPSLYHYLTYTHIATTQGLSEAQVKEVVDKKIKEMDLSEYAGRNASTFSGGNKRKLSVAMAMIGRPLIVFLDGVWVGVGGLGVVCG